MNSQVAREQVYAVKSRLLPLPRFEAVMERWVERLPRRLFLARLAPIRAIETIDENKGEYKSTGSDPCFELVLDSTALTGGWFYLEAALARNNGSKAASLQVEAAGSNAHSFTWPITTNLRGSIREVIWLPPDVTCLRWVPTAAPGFFSQSPILVHKISNLESAARRLHRVLLDRGQYGRRSPATGNGLTVWRALTNLQAAYRLTAELRMDQARSCNYAALLAHTETAAGADTRYMRKQIKALRDAPLISIIMTLKNPAHGFLGEAIASVAVQLYPHWELCIAADADVPQDAVALVKQWQAKDPRIKLAMVAVGLGTASQLNHAVDLARGDYIAVLGQHDQMPAHALYHVAQEIIKHPEAELVYTDEDKIDAFGKRLDPAFKPDWNPDLLLSTNYISSLAVYSRAVVVLHGGYSAGFDGAEDYELLLRLFGKSGSSRNAVKARHIAKVMYCKRVLKDGEATAHAAGLRALQNHLKPSGATAMDGAVAGVYRVRHPLPAQTPLVSLIIPTRDKAEVLKKCVESILRLTDYPNWEMLVVDNGSQDPQTHEYFREIERNSRIKVLRYAQPFNFSAINNFAARLAKGEILGLLNNDLEVISPEWLTEMVSHAVRPEIGAVGAKLLYPDGMVQHAGVVLGIGGVAGHVHKFLSADDTGYCHRASVAQNLSAVTGACMVVRKQVYWEAGGMNAANLAVAFNDIDFCLKLRKAGYRNLFTPHALLYHHESLSRGRDDTPEKSEVFKQEYAYMKNTWREKLQGDPAYNINLTLDFEDFSFSSVA